LHHARQSLPDIVPRFNLGTRILRLCLKVQDLSLVNRAAEELQKLQEQRGKRMIDNLLVGKE
jgi:hypothetical protein